MKVQSNKATYYRYLFNVYILNRGTITKSWRSVKTMLSEDYLRNPVSAPYPFDFSGDVTDKLLTDKYGIPMVDYTNLGIHYNPWYVGHIALGVFNRYKCIKSDTDLKYFRALADWFINNAVETPVGLVWLYHFDWFGGQKQPWTSGLSQAHAISVLLRASVVFNNPGYEMAARNATVQLITSTSNGGHAYEHPDGTISFEEYQNKTPISVLNGHLFAAIACQEASRHFNSENFKKPAQKAWEFVLNRLNAYDLGFWSSYSLKKIVSLHDISGTHYHRVHIEQFRVAYAITGEPLFREYAQRFEDYLNSWSCRLRALWYKRLTKLLWERK